MIRNANQVYMDLGTVLRGGVEGWQEGLIWPTSVHDLPKIFTDLWEGYKRIIARCGDFEIQRALLGSHLVPWELYQILVSVRNLQRVDELGRAPIVSSHSNLYSPLIEKSPLPGPLSFGKWRLERATLKRLLRHPANFYLSCKYNLPYRKLPALMKKENRRRVVALYKPVPLCEQFMSTLGNWVDVRLISTWFGENERLRLSEDLLRGIEWMGEDLASLFAEIAHCHGVEVGGEHLEHCKMIASTLLTRTARDLAWIRQALRREGALDYLGVSGTNYYSRILSLVVQELGGTVTSFNHGGASCRYIVDYSLPEFSTCTRFGVENTPCIKLFEKLFELFPRPLKNQIQFFSVNYDSYRTLWESLRDRPPPSRVKRIMLMSHPYHGDFSHHCQYPDPIKWDVELRIIRQLQSAGYDVVYKPHPGGRYHTLRADFLPLGVQVISEPFEAVLDEADAYVYYCTDSTTMASAVCTKKPIVFIDCGFEQWFDDPWELFRKRAHVVSGGFDEDNRMTFDETALLHVLQKTPEEPDEGFLKKYFFPDGAS